MDQILIDALPELIATLIGVAVGGSLAFANENLRNRRARDRQAYVILRSLARELHENYEVVSGVLPHFRKTTHGKSYFLTTSAWETALSTEELPNIIGFKLADKIGHHYGILARLRYYGELLVQVWLTTDSVEGYVEIKTGFRRIIIDSLEQVMNDYPLVREAIEKELVRLHRPQLAGGRPQPDLPSPPTDVRTDTPGGAADPPD